VGANPDVGRAALQVRDIGGRFLPASLNAGVANPGRASLPWAAMETTLILLKPDCIRKGHCGDVLQRFEKAGFRLRGCKMMRLGREILREHYAHIAAKPFFGEVEEFMQSSPVIAIALEAEGAVEQVRTLLGPTDSKKAAKGTIRGDFGVDVMVNVVHASDSLETAKKELKRFFNEGELFD
jgi:nucleoside-diphosphate kinase